MKRKALILFSGGIDSTTALYWARHRFADVTALTFAYDQKHRIEVEMARTMAAKLGCGFHLWHLAFQGFLSSALIDEDKEIPDSLDRSKDTGGMPFTYVPFRNGIFLSLAAAFAETHGLQDMVTGFNCIDTPDYPDTTIAFTRKMQAAINQGTMATKTGKKLRIHTPLITLSKKEIIELGLHLNIDYSYSISCYRGSEIPCQKCPSCEVRLKAFRELRLADPLIARLQKEGKL